MNNFLPKPLRCRDPMQEIASIGWVGELGGAISSLLEAMSIRMEAGGTWNIFFCMALLPLAGLYLLSYLSSLFNKRVSDAVTLPANGLQPGRGGSRVRSYDFPPKQRAEPKFGKDIGMNRLVHDALKRVEHERTVEAAPKDIVKMARNVIYNIVETIEPKMAPSPLVFPSPRRAQAGSVEVLQKRVPIGSPLGKWPGTPTNSPCEKTPRRRARMRAGPVTPQISNIEEIRGHWSMGGGVCKVLLLKYIEQFIEYKDWLASNSQQTPEESEMEKSTAYSRWAQGGVPTKEVLQTCLSYHRHVCTDIDRDRWDELCTMLEMLIHERDEAEGSTLVRNLQETFYDAAEAPYSPPSTGEDTTASAGLPSPELDGEFGNREIPRLSL